MRGGRSEGQEGVVGTAATAGSQTVESAEGEDLEETFRAGDEDRASVEDAYEAAVDGFAGLPRWMRQVLHSA